MAGGIAGSGRHIQEYSTSLVRVIVWSGLVRNFKTPLIGVEGTMNAARSRQLPFDSGVIDQMSSLHGMRGWVFQDDGASPHLSKPGDQRSHPPEYSVREISPVVDLRGEDRR
jgi:hypothetical protein